MTPNTCYEDYERTLEKGDMLFFFTDGLQELMNGDRAQFGPKELQRVTLSNMRLSPNRFLDAVLCAAYAFSDDLPVHDDMTLLVASYE
jgi:sigma-B regulation protein RsbU (phosphoserine phosphatase)